MDLKEMLEMSAISLSLDSYNDIFSDFDTRPYSERALSEDFLSESKRATRDKASGRIELKLLLPENKRDIQSEGIIKKRLKDHFKKHSESTKGEAWKTLRQGLIFAAVGIILMLAATFILFQDEDPSILRSFLIVFLEPGGWFLFWEGLNLVIFEKKKLKPDLDFYNKMSRAEIKFLSY